MDFFNLNSVSKLSETLPLWGLLLPFMILLLKMCFKLFNYYKIELDRKQAEIEKLISERNDSQKQLVTYLASELYEKRKTESLLPESLLKESTK
jgi:hypothetical protein